MKTTTLYTSHTRFQNLIPLFTVMVVIRTETPENEGLNMSEDVSTCGIYRHV